MIPEKREAYFYAQDVFYQNYNSLSFFVEDAEKEELYFLILKKLFKNVQFEKIFPLCGKQNVLEHSRENLGNEKYIYILDKDFDDILGLIVENENLIYLDRYSIENYLIEPSAICSFIISKRPTINRKIVNSCIDIDSMISDTVIETKKLVPLFILVQRKLYNRIATTSHCIDDFLDQQTLKLSESKLTKFIGEVIEAFESENISLNVTKEACEIYEELELDKYENALAHTPGKYISYLLLKSLKKKFPYINTTTEDQFQFSLATYSELDTLSFLKTKVDQLNHN